MTPNSHLPLQLVAALFFGTVLALIPTSAISAPNAGLFIYAWGMSDPKIDPATARAHSVFEKVLRTADRSASYRPRLVVVNSPSNPWAVALSDGSIVLSRGAVDVAYRDASPEVGDARLAFVVGHELAHLGKDDFWHQRIYLALMGDPSSPNQAMVDARQPRDDILALLAKTTDVARAEESHRLAVTRQKELQADDYGFIYAALAGYAVDKLVDPKEGKDFFRHWMEQTHTSVDASHPDPEQRAELLRVRLGTLLDQIEFFNFGVRLAHFGAYPEAESLLRAFQKEFPGREVDNDLGYLYLAQAIEKMPGAISLRYALPAILDLTTQADDLRAELTRRGEDLPAEAAAQLGLAIKHFARASEADTEYVPAHVNLAVSSLLLGEVYKARAAIEIAARLVPNDLRVQGLRAVIAYEEGRQLCTAPGVVKDLESLAFREGAGWELRYNLARMLDDLGSRAQALPVWDALAQDRRLPKAFATQACKQASRLPECPALAGRGNVRVPPVPWPVLVVPGTDVTQPDNAKTLLAPGWRSLRFDWSPQELRGSIHWGPDAVSVLVIDGFVEMTVVRSPNFGTVSELMNRCGQPTTIETRVGGEIWTYDDLWAALIRDGRVTEVWVRKGSEAEAQPELRAISIPSLFLKEGDT